MKRLFAKVIGIIALLLLGANSAQAMPRLLFWKKALNLTEQQENTIRNIFYQSSKELIMLRARLQIANLELKKLLEQHRPDPKAVMKALENVSAAQLAVRKNRVLMMLKIQSVLTPQQFKKFREIRAMRKQRRRWKRWMRKNRQGRWMRKRGPRGNRMGQFRPRGGPGPNGGMGQPQNPGGPGPNGPNGN